MSDRLVARVVAFGGPEAVLLRSEEHRPAGRTTVGVRVTHASLGSTDVVARRGHYLLQPRAGFVPGYDFVGVLERTGDQAAGLGLSEGMRVAGCLPRMGAHATWIDVAPSLLVPVPEGLDSSVAATLPLDLITARRAIDLLDLPPHGSVLVQGVTGPVGGLVAQHAVDAGLRVYGTASRRTRQLAEARGAHVLDYAETNWPAQLLRLEPLGVDGTVDHLGGEVARRVTAPSGRVVRTAFAGRPGRERRDALARGMRTVARFRARPAERLCSIPQYVVTHRRAYRRLLAEQLSLVAEGQLTPPPVRVVPFSDVVGAHGVAEQAGLGEKVVLVMGPGS